MTAPHAKTDSAVLGGGPGGSVAALAAARRGARVAPVEKGRGGGMEQWLKARRRTLVRGEGRPVRPETIIEE